MKENTPPSSFKNEKDNAKEDTLDERELIEEKEATEEIDHPAEEVQEGDYGRRSFADPGFGNT